MTDENHNEFTLGGEPEFESEVPKIPTSGLKSYQSIESIRATARSLDINASEDETLKSLDSAGGTAFPTTAVFDEQTENGGATIPLNEAMSWQEFKQDSHYQAIYDAMVDVLDTFQRKSEDLQATKDSRESNHGFFLGAQTVVNRVGALFIEADERVAVASPEERARMGKNPIGLPKNSPVQVAISEEENARRVAAVLASLPSKK